MNNFANERFGSKHVKKKTVNTLLSIDSKFRKDYFKEITINDEDLSEDEGFIYPSKLLTFYEEGYEHKLSNTSTIKNRKIQFIELTPIDTNSEIVKVVLGIEVSSKHIYQLVQFGENGAKTILTINKFKSDQNITDELFNFNRLKYETLDYLID